MCRKLLGIWIESKYIHVLCCLEAKFVLCSCVFKLNKVNISTYQHLAFLHQTLFLNILAGAACSDGMSMSTNRYLWITKQMRLCRVKVPIVLGGQVSIVRQGLRKNRCLQVTPRPINTET